MEKYPATRHFVVPPTRIGVVGMKYVHDAILKY